jgi:exopolysaccharide biosynthesis protein
LAANVIKTVTQTQAGQNHPRAPVGLTLSFPAALFPADWAEIGTTLQIKMLGWNKVRAAIGAGPLLVNDGQICIDLQTEGWYTSNSIRTQAARLDYTDMRGPKIAIGLGKRGNLSVVAINGRIRESVGATYQDMAEILVELGMQKAMGFDPGGSGTLVVNGKPVNISPYNANYEQDVYSLPPQPRAVGNAVIGYQEFV